MVSEAVLGINSEIITLGEREGGTSHRTCAFRHCKNCMTMMIRLDLD